MSTRAIRHLVIRGRVQGVGYRAFAEYTALDHGLAGWVRNRRDGAVEAGLAGAAAAGAPGGVGFSPRAPPARLHAPRQRAAPPPQACLSRAGALCGLPTGL